ncbi:capsular polysaccharide biosynthesis protein [Cytophaga hutchinsonii ATCC 33406]|uniref:Capsular polysaccharide biosynthesis protein n=1 Tax=Cytophaga hutchinsonii (strain ATCC 33406 / DSM 1761 / CIP 103989 / NBRC 15051 / NCIMB 9469 / D465) TaxID=269798 RepID=A0A6N4SPB4_CYTH3|nr:capsular polysaccharide biosynthesis protein [Cytophaga hutchinsonii ATCC 33406]
MCLQRICYEKIFLKKKIIATGTIWMSNMQQINNASVRPVSAYNTKHLQIPAIALLQSSPLPEQAIRTFSRALLTPTNHLFVNGRYIRTGLISGFDSRKLSFFQRIYLFLKSRFFTENKSVKISAVWAHDSWSNNYFHWFNDTLPRLFLLSKQIEDSVAVLPVELSKITFIVESLELLKIEHQWIDQKKSHRFESLSVLHTATLQPDINPLLQKQMRDAVFSAMKIDPQERPFRKIYISRAHARYRKIINEQELLPVLKKYGYDIIYPETYSFKEQVKLFAESNALISIHGAGHTNCMFMKQDAKVMEIRNTEWESQPLCFWGLANIFELKWEYITATRVSEVSNFNDVFIAPHIFEESLRTFENIK